MNRGNSPPDQPPDALNFLVESPTFNDVPDANFMWSNGIGSMPVSGGSSNVHVNNGHASSGQARAPASASASATSAAYNQFSLDDASALQQQQQQQQQANNNTAGYLPMNYSLPQHLTMQYAGTAAGVGLPPSVVSTADSSYASSATGSKRASASSKQAAAAAVAAANVKSAGAVSQNM
eukprot:CAMPEP_0116014474 /NCGR_PEP_ID=MMETSP0321-20121206/6292_1 /TAXON_ID=163516 /ORGANISM="Leptocylindrus danicus var. danicus, Strain B650" /LENGTH=178 /DNA_ID=CAMNT_0003484119 /DNA_START=173 /DNA_END=706 /DNA_ORIENTATION=+